MRISELPPVRAVRSSFRRKLLLGLLASVSTLAAVTLFVVRRETDRQVDIATRQATQRSREAFVELEEFNRARLSQLSVVFTGSVQAAAALEGALETGDFQTLAQDVDYEFEARRIPHTLVAFTDDAGVPVLAMLDRETLPGDDPAGVRSLAARMLAQEQPAGVRGYRAVRGTLYTVETMLLDLGRPIGTVSLGVPITDEDAQRLGSVIGAEVCFAMNGQCAAATPRARAALSGLLAKLSGSVRTREAWVDGAHWRLVSDSVAGGGGLWRVIAVPLDPVVAPFERVKAALLFGLAGALLLAVGIAIAISRSLTEPVKALVAATARVGDGDLEARVRVTSLDEMGVLGRAFNAMTEGLALKERYRGILDKIVSRDVAEELVKGDVVLGGENRHVTTLFADITSFTTITDGMEPAGVIALLNECMERLSNVVEAEGGVVDKYVGDQIMAIFGAPITRTHDPLRACRAAVGMQHAMIPLNEQRRRRGEPELRISVGINTGVVMAGNMGSPRRLNYTVLGDAVNLAARVQHRAEGGQILISEATHREVEGHVRVRDLGPAELRGFVKPVRLYELLAVHDSAPVPDPRRSGGHRMALTALAIAALAVAPPSARAQRELPTLADLRLSTADGRIQAALSGRADLEGYLPGRDPAWIIPSTSAFVAPRVRLFGDVFVGERIVLGSELRADRGEEPREGPLELRVDQLFARVVLARGVALQAGKFVTPFGGYAQRHHTGQDPLVRPPLPYDHRTVLTSMIAPASAQALIAWRDFPADWRPWGAPVIWGAPYQWGGMLLGDAGPLAWRAAVMNSAPSSEPEEWGLDRGFSAPSYVVNVGVQLAPPLRISLSYDQGPWLARDVVGLPAGRSPRDYDQRLIGAELVLQQARSTVRGEVLHDTWAVPNVGYDVVDVSWYVEAEQVLVAGLSAAARYGAIHFAGLRGAGTTAYAGEPWDHDVARLQLGVGYRVARNAGVRVEAMFNRSASPTPPRNDLGSMQLWWAF